MKLGFVSSYPPLQCGIGTYSEKLIAELLKVPEVSAIHLATRKNFTATPPDSRMTISHCYESSSDYVEEVFGDLKSAGVDVVHIQHAPDLFGIDGRLPRLVRRLSDHGIPTAVTLHTVYGPRISSYLGLAEDAPGFHRKIARTGHIVVHHETIRSTLIRQGAAHDRVTAIPHGTVLLTPEDRNASRRSLGLPGDATIFLFFGFIHAQKNLHCAIMAFLLAARELPNAFLVIAGMPRAQLWYNRIYYNALRGISNLHPLKEQIIWHNRFIKSEDVQRYFSAADVILLPHAFQYYGSASGILHLTIGSGRPFIATRERKFSELRSIEGLPEICTVPAANIFAWARSMKQLGSDEALRIQTSNAAMSYANKTSWRSVAEQHMELYRRQLKCPARPQGT